MVLQAIRSLLHDIVYEMASTAEPIPLEGGVQGLGDVAPPSVTIAGKSTCNWNKHHCSTESLTTTVHTQQHNN